ncbi:MAG TPA: sulfite exporter TauE/SafE family protein, partial [Oceanicaulis sp.]|nr:sulfite exporter TauE/SafE family protein [Oceanicaulis sp.]
MTALAGGAAYGFSAGIFGVGGAVRGAFLSAYDLPKSVYIFTAGAIGLAIDSGRIVTYIWQGAALDTALLWGLAIFVPVS